MTQDIADYILDDGMLRLNGKVLENLAIMH
jgi:hypothetical protein